MKAYLFLAVLGALVAGACSQHDPALYAPLSNIPSPGEGFETAYFFPEHASLQFPAGDTIEIIAGLHSGSSETYNISAIFGSLNNHLAFSQYFYNFTPTAYQRSIRPGEEVSLSYSFWIPYNFPAREFQVALTAFYTSEGSYHASTFFNKTIDVVEKPKWVDLQLIFLYLLLVAAIGGLGYLAYSYVISLGYFRKQKSKRTPKRAASGTASTSSPDEWLKGTNFAQGNKPPRKSASKGDVRKASPIRGVVAPDN
ncbi:hypothetical protein WJX73_006510 [Symbiochloris irregularis]|uniref:Translocon-associated protein subunit alpha n=1 Tax=Symbiochloris irregularis TaxID=706552 RepID=A0AAW1NNZ8_9CHLO